MGTKGRGIYDTLKPAGAAGSSQPVGEVLTIFDGYCNPKQNETVERYNYFTRNQEAGEQLDRYITDLKVLAQTCKFEILHDSLIRDRIICGIKNSSLREQLLREQNLTLKKCGEMCQAAELMKVRIKTIETQNEVHSIRQNARRSKDQLRKQLNKCKYCGYRHPFGKEHCPAYGKSCLNCGKLNHLASQCKSLTRSAKAGKHNKVDRPKVHAVGEETGNNSDSSDSYSESTCDFEDRLRMNHVNSINSLKHHSHIYADMIIDDKRVTFQLDSGATCNILPFSEFVKLGKHGIKKTRQVLAMYNGSTSEPKGKCRLKLVNPRNNKKYRAEFVIVEGDKAIPLCSRAVQQMGLIEVKHESILLSH
ncbi:hypothetical protein HOLleu_21584 [Holothuria leucospilota]|uniref:CCHC-type domain-containing protein n=1 Tax=Holothuria leucospilota TaxID=206669 RepID=A0A9Q1BY50_HOLLE|nr:hypothetical protein HOLleu_21584 [Holothuria leucospilota]